MSTNVKIIPWKLKTYLFCIILCFLFTLFSPNFSAIKTDYSPPSASFPATGGHWQGRPRDRWDQWSHYTYYVMLYWPDWDHEDPGYVMCANNTDIAPLWPLKVSRGQGRAGEDHINNAAIQQQQIQTLESELESNGGVLSEWCMLMLTAWCVFCDGYHLNNAGEYTQKQADIVDIPSVFHLVISPAQGDITYGQGDITFTL